MGITTSPQDVELTPGPVPTSRDAPHLLAVAYALEEMPSQAVSAASVTIKLRAVNTGAATWLAEAADDSGAVRLGWRWYKEGEHRHGWSGRELLRYDVLPWGSYRFRARIPTPLEPGEYMLELDMVSELVTWFADRGNTPVRLAVRLLSPSDTESLPGE